MKKLFKILGTITICFVLIFLYGMFFETKKLIVKEYKVTNEKVASNHGLKVVHLSDIHYGFSFTNIELNNLINKINELEPDIIFFTGDLVDDGADIDEDELINSLNNLKANLGKYYISGNHDLKDNIDDIYFKSNFINLNNDYKILYHNEPFIISGISSLSSSGSITEKTDSFDTNITQYENLYSILLIHEPDIVNEINTDNYDLILAGHSHGGQVRIPLLGKLYTPVGAKDYYDEYYKLNSTDLYISSGVGTTSIDVRLFNKPSLNLYRITK